MKNTNLIIAKRLITLANELMMDESNGYTSPPSSPQRSTTFKSNPDPKKAELEKKVLEKLKNMPGGDVEKALREMDQK